MREILITGASGFTARSLVAKLRDDPDIRINLVSRRLSAKSPAGWKRHFPTDWQDTRLIKAILEEAKPSWIFHLAGALKGTASELFQANVQNTIHLLEAACEIVPQARILLIGSAAEYGDPLNDFPISEEHPCRPVGPYGVSKYAMTLAGLDFAKRTKLQINVARTFNLIGPSMPNTLLLGAVLDRLQKAIEQGTNTIKVGDISAERDFIDVRDAVNAYLMIMKSDANGQVFNVCSGIGTSISDVVETALKTAPRLICHEYDPKLGAGGAKSVVGNPQKIQGLGFRPRISLAQSIVDTCAKPRAK